MTPPRKASQMLLGDPVPDQSPEANRTYQERVFDAAVELSIKSDKFRRDLLKKLKGLSETKKKGTLPTPKFERQHVRFAVELIINSHKQTRGEGWKKKAQITEAIKEAAKLLGITKKQATDRYYSSEKFPD